MTAYSSHEFLSFPVVVSLTSLFLRSKPLVQPKHSHQQAMFHVTFGVLSSKDCFGKMTWAASSSINKAKGLQRMWIVVVCVHVHTKDKQDVDMTSTPRGGPNYTVLLR